MFLVRRVHGDSMLPALFHGQIVVARMTRARLTPGEVVIIRHGGHEKIKRVTRVVTGKIFIEGDNISHSTDSRQFGWIDIASVRGKVIWPANLSVTKKSRA